MSDRRAQIVCVASDDRHRFSKQPRESIMLLAGLGVDGDAHAGVTMRHRSRWRKTPAAPNVRQVHLLHAELFEELAEAGFDVAPAQMGENVTTRGIDLLGLPRGARLRLGSSALIEVTGLRNPCVQIDRNIGKGAMAATLERADDGTLTRKSGVMAIVLESGEVRAGDAITVEQLPQTHEALVPV